MLSSITLKPFETKERMAEISKRWKELDDAEKAVYNAKATQVININSNDTFPILQFSLSIFAVELLLQDEVCCLSGDTDT